MNCQPPDYLTNGWKRLKTSQVFWKLGSNPSTFEEAEATCTGRIISEAISVWYNPQWLEGHF